LRSCYVSSLSLAAERRLASIAFPCISTGIFGYPPADACRVAVSAVVEWLTDHEHPGQVMFCCFSQADQVLYRQRIDALRGGPSAE
jgi:O-acetyl-ADP-ribose deacetylase (regulator of RNase III)